MHPCDRAASNWRQFKESKYAFHRALALATRNSFITHIFDLIIATRRNKWESDYYHVRDMIDARAACLDECRTIVDALLAGDGQGATEAIRRSLPDHGDGQRALTARWRDNASSRQPEPAKIGCPREGISITPGHGAETYAGCPGPYALRNRIFAEQETALNSTSPPPAWQLARDVQSVPAVAIPGLPCTLGDQRRRPPDLTPSARMESAPSWQLSCTSGRTVLALAGDWIAQSGGIPEFPANGPRRSRGRPDARLRYRRPRTMG